MTRLVLAALLAGALTAHAEEPGFKVIVNASNPADALTRSELTLYFMKKTSRWPGDQAVVPIEPPEQSAARQRFSTEVLGKSAATLKAYWSRLVFAGRDTPPQEKGSEDEVVAAVRANPGAIGYVGPSAATAGVKVVRVKD